MPAEKNSYRSESFWSAFRPLFKRIPQKVSNAQVRYIVRKLKLTPGKHFLDCPCGPGRIAIPLARKGIRVTGVDMTPPYLDELGRRAKNQGLRVKLICGDMRRVRFEAEFDGAASIWTSFGYFDRESDDLLVLKKMYRALKPGGKFMLHLINRDWVIANYVARDWVEVGHLKVLEKRTFDYGRSICRSVWTFVEKGDEKVFENSIRMYSCHELFAMFRSVGFVDIEGFGSVNDEPIGRDKRMMFVIGTRPKGK